MKTVTAAAVVTATVASNISYAWPTSASDMPATLPGSLRYMHTQGVPKMPSGLTSNLSFVQQTESLVASSVSPQEAQQMISRPKTPVEFVKNLKVIFDRDLLLGDAFYAEENLRDIFNLERVSVAHGGDGAERSISISGHVLDSVFPRIKTSEFMGGSMSGARFGGGKTIRASGAVTAALNFGMYAGSPDFDEAMKIFSNKFVRLPSMPSPHGGPGAPTASHGSETWRSQQVDGGLQKTMTIAFNSAGKLSDILIELKKN
ncbi:hypothetical protein ACW910_35570 (plasmid) [Burkholderia ambifaria]